MIINRSFQCRPMQEKGGQTTDKQTQIWDSNALCTSQARQSNYRNNWIMPPERAALREGSTLSTRLALGVKARYPRQLEEAFNEALACWTNEHAGTVSCPYRRVRFFILRTL
ncbi:hypothetical protein BDW67DRAFT_166683 [Aspergillus spinulosporus]